MEYKGIKKVAESVFQKSLVAKLMRIGSIKNIPITWLMVDKADMKTVEKGTCMVRWEVITLHYYDEKKVEEYNAIFDKLNSDDIVTFMAAIDLPLEVFVVEKEEASL